MMQQKGIGSVIGATTSDVLKKLKEAGQDSERRHKPRVGKDTVSISAEAREMMATELSDGEEGEAAEYTDQAE
jgi:hypothetical protein